MKECDRILGWLEKFDKGVLTKRVALVISKYAIGADIEKLVKKKGYSPLRYSATSPALFDFIKDLTSQLVSPVSISTLFGSKQRKQVVIVEDLNCLKTNHSRAFSTLAKLGRLKLSGTGQIPIICTCTGTSDKLLTSFLSNSTPIDLTSGQTAYKNGYLQKADELLGKDNSLAEVQLAALTYDPTILSLILYESIGSYVNDVYQRDHYLKIIGSLCRGDTIDYQAFKAHQSSVGYTDKANVLAEILYHTRNIEDRDKIKLKFSKILTKASSAKSLSTLMKAKCNALGIKSRELREKILNGEDIHHINKSERSRLERLYT